jgi:glutamate racemase
MSDHPGTAGLLHTVPALAETFQRSLGALAPELRLVHLADPELLARAISVGVDDHVHDRVLGHVRHLVTSGAQAVMVTCSSVAESADRAARLVDVPVLRVDEAMARRALRIASEGQGRITALATLDSTLGPTGRLLHRLAEGSGAEVRTSVVAGAAEARTAGDLAEHDRLVRDAVSRAANGSDVVVLAQASMAAAAGSGSGVPVLESVSTGSARLVEILSGASGTVRGKC